MKRYWLLLIITISLFCTTHTPATIAQTDRLLSDYPIITAENVAGLQQVRVLGQGYINDVIFSPDEQFVAMATTVGIWLYSVDDLETPIHLFGDYAINVTYAMFSPDGSRLFGGVQGGSVYIWDVASGELLTMLMDANGEDIFDAVLELQLSDDEQYLYVLTTFYFMRWDLLDNTLEKNILLYEERYDDRVETTRQLSADKQHILVHHLDFHYGYVSNPYINSEVKIINIETTDSYILEIKNEFLSAFFDDTGTRILTDLGNIQSDVLVSGSTAIWDTASGERLHTVGEEGMGYKSPIYAKNVIAYYNQTYQANNYSRLLLSRDQSKLIFFYSNRVQIWDIETNTMWGSFEIDTTLSDKDSIFKPYETISPSQIGNEAEILQFIEDENILYRIPLWYSPSSDNYFYEKPDLVYHSPQNTHFLSHNEDAFRIWDIETGELAFKIDFMERCTPSRDSTLSLDDTRLVVYQNEKSFVCVWDTESQQVLYRIKSERFGGKWLLDNRHFLIAGETQDQFRIIQVWDLQTDTFFEIITPYRGGREIANFSPDGRYFILLNLEGSIAYIWDLQTRELIQEIDHPESASEEIIFSPDSQMVALAFGGMFRSDPPDNPIYVRNTNDWETNYKIQGFSYGINNIIFSPNSHYVLVSGYNFIGMSGVVVVWNAQTGELLYAIPPELTGYNFQFNYDSSQLAITSESTTNPSILILDAVSGVPIQDINLGIQANDEEPYIYVSSLNFSPVTNLITIRVNNQIAQIWDTDTSLLVHTMPAFGSYKSIRFNDDGTLLVTEGDGVVRIWGVPEG